MTNEQRQLILDTLESDGTFTHQEAEWERQTRTGRNQKRAADVCETIFACTTLGFSAAMLTVVISVKMLTQSVSVARLDIHHGTKACQGNWKCGLLAELMSIAFMISNSDSVPLLEGLCTSGSNPGRFESSGFQSFKFLPELNRRPWDKQSHTLTN